ncbi:hypothetical protein [[Leptolyngbya] sp. PCC 7376]|uniref:hypothetical protein n=1 Tax=[Leptolyngbya] sp. PCC 7376 TaxID=111781 RepID=UPI00030830AD
MDAYERGGVSQSSLARQFGVAKSFVQKLLDQKRLTGSIAPKKRSQQTPPKLNEEQSNNIAPVAHQEKRCDASGTM